MDVVEATAERVTEARWRLPERLPNLHGRWLIFYTILWAMVLPLAIAGQASGLYYRAQSWSVVTWPAFGFETSNDGTKQLVITVFSRQARAAGLGAGDRLLTVDGQPLPPGADGRERREALVTRPEGSDVRFTFQHEREPPRDVVLTRRASHVDELYAGSGFNAWTTQLLGEIGLMLAPLGLIAAAVLLFVRGRREAVPAALSLGFLLLAAVAFDSRLELFGFPSEFRAMLGIPAWTLILAALLVFPSGRLRPRWTAYLLMAMPLILMAPPLADAMMFGSEILGAVTIVATLLMVVAANIQRYRGLDPGPELLQLRWSFLGVISGLGALALAIPFIMLSVANVGDDPRWLVWTQAIIIPIASLSILLMALGLIVSLLRYRLYDADTVIGRSAAFGVLTIGFVALFAGSEKLIEAIGQQYFGGSLGAAAGGIGAALAAVMIAPLHGRISRWAEHRFQAQLVRMRRGLPRLVSDLRETAPLTQIAAVVLDGVGDGVRTSRSALLVGERIIGARGIAAEEVETWQRGWVPSDRDGLDCDRADSVFPLRVPLEADGHGRVGWLLLGPRPDDSFIGKDERHALAEIADPIARAIEIVVSRERREAEQERRLSAVEQALGEAMAAIARLSTSATGAA